MAAPGLKCFILEVSGPELSEINTFKLGGKGWRVLAKAKSGGWRVLAKAQTSVNG